MKKSIFRNKNSPFVFNFSVIVCILAIVYCVFSIALIANLLQEAEYYTYAAIYGTFAIVLSVLLVFSGLRKKENSPNLGFIYLLTFLILAYVIVNLSWSLSELGTREAAILADDVAYTTDSAKVAAIQELESQTYSIALFDVLAAICILVSFYFETIKALDGEVRWPFNLVMTLSLVFLLMAAYTKVNILDNMGSMDSTFMATFFQSRTPLLIFAAVYIISYRSDYNPEKDTYLTAATASK
jgi:hypothetical protein